MNRQSGFTLLELMIIVAIISILSAVAVAAYEDYTIRARVSEVSALVSGAKATIGSNIANNGGIVAAGACAGVDVTAPDTANVLTFTCADATGAITVATTPRAGSLTLLYTPTAGAGAVGTEWACTLSTGAEKYVPNECRA